jgi:hypothetical protein
LKKLFFQKSFEKISEIKKTKNITSASGHALRRVLVSVLAKAGPSKPKIAQASPRKSKKLQKSFFKRLKKYQTTKMGGRVFGEKK